VVLPVIHADPKPLSFKKQVKTALFSG